MFQQTVVSVYASDPERIPDLNQLGENTNITPTNDGEVEETTTSDREDNKEVESDSGEDYDEYLYYKSYENKKETDLTLDTENRDSGEDYEEYKEDPYHYQEETQEEHSKTDYAPDKEEDSDNEQQTSEDAAEGLSNPEQDANQSSSVEPAWGAWRKQSAKECEEDWKVWNEANQDGTTQTYSHGRCHLCNKPVSTLNPKNKFTCFECKRYIAENEGQENDTTTQGLGKTDKDDEEEWGRIPIPQSDDSDEDTWLDEAPKSESEEEETIGSHTPTKKIKQGEHKNKKFTEDLAFRYGPRRDGIVKMKDGTLLIPHGPLPLTTTFTLMKTNSHHDERRDSPRDEPTKLRWNHHVLSYQRRNLKMRYKSKTKGRAKLMKAIRRHTVRHDPILMEKQHPLETQTTATALQLKQLCLLVSNTSSPMRQYDTTAGYTNDEQPTYQKRAILHQCMNAIASPMKTTPKRRNLKIKIKVKHITKTTKRRIPNIITVPGTPEQNDTTTGEDDQKKQQDKDEDLNLYYKVFRRYKPEVG